MSSLPLDMPMEVRRTYPELNNIIQLETDLKIVVILQIASVVLELSTVVYSVLKKYGKLRLGMCVYQIDAFPNAINA